MRGARRRPRRGRRGAQPRQRDQARPHRAAAAAARWSAACGSRWRTAAPSRSRATRAYRSSHRATAATRAQSSLQAGLPPRPHLRYPMKRTNPKGEDPGWRAHHAGTRRIDTIGDDSSRQIKDQYGRRVHVRHGAARRASVVLHPTAFYKLAVRQRPTAMWRLPRSARARATLPSARSTSVDGASAGWPLRGPAARCSCSGAARPRAPTTTTACRNHGERDADHAETHICVDPRTVQLWARRPTIWLNREAAAPTARWPWPGSTSSSRTTSWTGSS